MEYTRMEYLLGLSLLAVIVAFGIFNYRHSRKKAEKMVKNIRRLTRNE